ncbi:16S rRNA (cytidine(1402)-2'-O)-methyltransferase [Candidatus Peribacteria bacterium]|nr:16S rRNA (cytidine(1402)-2'-O)-methyltransferase [Candidatus Peribacteria bacterium]MBT4021669.1 16S rRNA (cytidine(1402)-2'-O)-methyltransferase [Candidatus Peribacteria bacterium]
MLSIVSTPIGNLGDISERAKSTLESCDAIICEDTRVTGKLIELLKLQKKELISFHSYSDKGKVNKIIERLESGDHLTLVSDAGTPGISDPGYLVVSEARSRGLDIEAIPGPSAFLSALSVSGLPINKFTYLGFLPLKKGRKTLIESFRECEHTVVFYESPHRIEKTLSEIASVLSDQPERKIVICRELTKMYEEVIEMSVCDAKKVLKDLKQKGEFCVVLAGK